MTPVFVFDPVFLLFLSKTVVEENKKNIWDFKLLADLNS